MALPRVEDAPRSSPLPLNHGDQLTLTEFRRLCDAHPEIKKAELIDGTVFLEMTVGSRHADIHSVVMGLLALYRARRPEIQSLDNGTVVLGRDEVQPDAALRLRDGGGSTEAEGRIEGPPELVIEVSASSYAYDSTLKRKLYERFGVREYLLLQIHEQRVEWWTLEGEQYFQIGADEAGIYESRVFPGLRLNAAALWAGDMAAVLGAL